MIANAAQMYPEYVSPKAKIDQSTPNKVTKYATRPAKTGPG